MSATQTEASSHNNPLHWNYSGLDDNNLQIQGSTIYFILVIFAIVVFATTLFFFAERIYRLFRPSGLHEDQHVGLDAAEIRKLPVVSYNKVSRCFNSDQAECVICLGILEEKDEVKVMPMCVHCFHSVCVDKWLKRHSSCPLCRSPVRLVSPV